MKIIHSSEKEPTPFKTLLGKMWRFEGMTNTINTYKYSSWKNNCPAHECWSPIIYNEELSADMQVKDVLITLKKILAANVVEINMRNNKFIDKIISDRPEREFELHIPESKLEETIQSNDELRKLSYRTIFHKCFYENIDSDFPYMELSLKEIGIPPYDIIQVSTEKGIRYVELSKDAKYYGL